MARWAVRTPDAHVLEPSVGDGVFLDGLQDHARDSGAKISVSGVEYSQETLHAVVSSGLLDPDRAIHSDFLAVQPFTVDAAIGNPPYVRLRHLPPAEARLARSRAEAVLGAPMEPSGSVWMPFVLHACQFLNRGGRLAFVLPYELTYVRYARLLWRYLGERFAGLRVARVRERLFPDILQETVVLYAEDFGGQTSRVRFDAFEECADFLAGAPSTSAELQLEDIVAGERVFVEALLEPDLRRLLGEVIRPATIPVGDVADIRIGYVTGDKDFFHPTDAVAREFALPQRSLHPALTSSRQLRHRGILTSSCEPRNLFLPHEHERTLSAGERRYIAHGAEEGVPERYKCRIREPWFLVPGVRVPDLVFPVFAQRPLALLNDAELAVSNSLLCGYLRAGGSGEGFLAGWYTSLTALQLELNVHALGGGVLILVPREVSAMRVLDDPAVPRRALATLNTLVAGKDLDGAFSWGDEHVLMPELGLSRADVAMIQRGCEMLARWRTSVTPSPPVAALAA